MKKVSALLTLSALLFSMLPVLTVSAQPAPIGRIAQNTNSAKFYFDRAQEKSVGANFDTKGAIADYDTAISIDPKYVDAYIYRGITKLGLEDNQGAIADVNTAISINPKSANAYLSRAYIKYDFLKDKQGGMSDMVKASELAREQGDMDTYNQATKKIEEWK